MRSFVLFNLMLALLLGISATAQAGEFWNLISGHWKCWPRCVGCTTCDDYCGKPAPCPPKVCGFTCPDYCRKCAPQVEIQCGGVCDDYCAKPLPPVICPKQCCPMPCRAPTCP